MRFVSTLKVSQQPDTPPPASLMEAIAALGMEATRSGALVDFAGLMPVGAGGGRVTLAGGTLTVTDGPFAESKELVSYAVYDVRSRDEALEWATRFVRLHQDHWAGWEGEADVQQVFEAPTGPVTGPDARRDRRRRLADGVPPAVVAVATPSSGDVGLARGASPRTPRCRARPVAEGEGMPENPARLARATAKHRAIDVLRRRSTTAAVIERGRAQPTTIDGPPTTPVVTRSSTHPVTDDLLQLIFLTCHPALTRESQVAVTLRLFGGLSTAEIARAFLVPEATVAQRISRAKRTLRDACGRVGASCTPISCRRGSWPSARSST